METHYLGVHEHIHVNGLASDTIYWSSRDSSRDFGGRKLRIPIFRDEDAYEWIIIAERYFKFNLLEENEKLDAVVIALEDKALKWCVQGGAGAAVST